MLFTTDPAWSIWVGKKIALANGQQGTVRMAQRRCAADRLWAVDSQGTMHEVTRRGTSRRVLRPARAGDFP